MTALHIIAKYGFHMLLQPLLDYGVETNTVKVAASPLVHWPPKMATNCRYILFSRTEQMLIWKSIQAQLCMLQRVGDLKR
jgi:hypothetical protein